MRLPSVQSPTFDAANPRINRLGLARLCARHRTFAYAGLALAGPVAARVATLHSVATLLPLFASALLASFLLPRYVRACIAIEDRLNSRFGRLTPGRVFRLLLVVLPMVAVAMVLNVSLAFSLFASFAAAGSQGMAARLAYRGIGDRATNAVLGYAAPLWLTAFAGVATDHRSPWIVALPLVALFLFDVMSGARSDISSRFPRPGGVGIFFGTFNPAHRTHIAIVEAALKERQLERVYLHCTTVPKLHRDALAADEIRFEYRDGMRVYRKTERADPNKNYFPTGNMFFEHDVRNALLKASVLDAGLEARVCVLDLPDLYEREGFLGVARHIRALHPDRPCHGLHGSDPGGMWVRNLFEACGGVQPFTVPRRDDVSATAIRKGAVGMTTPTVERFLAAVREGRSFVFDDGHVFTMDGAAAPVTASNGADHACGAARSAETGRGPRLS